MVQIINDANDWIILRMYNNYIKIYSKGSENSHCYYKQDLKSLLDAIITKTTFFGVCIIIW